MTVNFNIHAAEWEFQEELPFDIVTIKDDITDFELPLYDKDDNESETVTMKNCRVIELIGDDESFLVIIEAALIKEENIFDVENTDRIFEFALHPNLPLWKDGEDIGVFYSWKNLPENLKEMKFNK
ncbi:MAG: hypothetical protein CMD18_00965 [Flavobacteriales bacterium]|nr:hypothetical protein [Flavobacteriales bacterium]